jgi:hypothetical protein
MDEPMDTDMPNWRSILLAVLLFCACWLILVATAIASVAMFLVLVGAR